MITLSKRFLVVFFGLVCLSLIINIPSAKANSSSTQEQIIVSDTTNIATDLANASSTHPAALVATPYNSRWTASIDGASWIWLAPTVDNPLIDESSTFTKNFTVEGEITSAVLRINADNSYEVKINGVKVAENSGEFNYFIENEGVFDVASALHSGENNIAITVKNFALASSTPQTNPAGLLYKLDIFTNLENPTSFIFKIMNSQADQTKKTFYNIGDNVTLFWSGLPSDAYNSTSSCNVWWYVNGAPDNAGWNGYVPCGTPGLGTFNQPHYNEGGILTSAHCYGKTGITTNIVQMFVKDASGNTLAESNTDDYSIDCTATSAVPSADVAITKSVDNTAPQASSAINYTLTVSALGPATSTGLTVIDVLPSELTFVSSTPSIGFYSSSTGVWDIGDLSASSTASLMIRAIVNQNTDGRVIINSASITQNASSSDPNTQNNTARTSISVVQNNLTSSNGGGGGGGGGGSSAVEFHVLLINNGAPTTTSTNVILSISGTPAYQMQISNTPDFANSEWELYATSKPWTLTNGAGEKIVYAKFRYTSGLEIDTVHDSIELVEQNVEGQVLGVSTTTVPSASCGAYLNSYIKLGARNDPEEVKKLQVFLNQELGINLPITGYYGQMTERAARQFQLKYNIAVLRPWVIHGLPNDMTSTGYVYKTTRWWINNLMCPQLGIPTPQLP